MELKSISVGLHPIAVPYQFPCEQRCKENDQSGSHECGKFEHEHIDELDGKEQTRKHFHGLDHLSKNSLVRLPPTPRNEWQEDKDHHRVARGTTDSEQSSSGIGRIMKSEIDKLRA